MLSAALIGSTKAHRLELRRATRRDSFRPIADISRLARTAAGLSVSAVVGTTRQALRKLLLLKEILHHPGDRISGSQPDGLPVTVPARPDLASLKAENDSARRFVG